MAQTGITLEQLRADLNRLEDTIIFGLIERAQYTHHRHIYSEPLVAPESGPRRRRASSHDGTALVSPTTTFLDHVLYQTECLHSSLGRYECPDEHPFSPQSSLSPSLRTDKAQHPRNCILLRNAINVTDQIKTYYINKIVPVICQSDLHDEHDNSGSSCVLDISNLQAIAKRVHYGMYVAHCKLQDSKASFLECVAADDRTKALDLLTRPDIEDFNLKRISKKAIVFGQDIRDPSHNNNDIRIDPEVIVGIYKDFIVPLTKEVELQYIQACLRTT